MTLLTLLLALPALAQAPPRLLERFDRAALASQGISWFQIQSVQVSTDGRSLVFVQQADPGANCTLVRLNLGQKRAEPPVMLPTQAVDYFAASGDTVVMAVDLGRRLLRLKGGKLEELPLQNSPFRFVAPPWLQGDLKGHFWTRGLIQDRVRKDQLFELQGSEFQPRHPLPNPEGIALSPSATWWVWLEDRGDGPVRLRSSAGEAALEEGAGFGMPSLSDVPGLLAYIRLAEQGASEAVVRRGDQVTSLGHGPFTDLAFSPAGDRVVLREGERVLVARSPDWKLAPLGLPAYAGKAGRLMQSLDGSTLVLLAAQEVLVFRLEQADFLP